MSSGSGSYSACKYTLQIISEVNYSIKASLVMQFVFVQGYTYPWYAFNTDILNAAIAHLFHQVLVPIAFTML